METGKPLCINCFAIPSSRATKKQKPSIIAIPRMIRGVGGTKAALASGGGVFCGGALCEEEEFIAVQNV